VDVATDGDTVTLSPAVTALSFPAQMQQWDLLPDGSGIVHVTHSAEDQAPDTDNPEVDGLVHVVLNWYSILNDLAPVPR
jgi:hypothetical protein